MGVGDGIDDGYESISRLLMRLAPVGDGAAYFRGQVQEAVNPRERVAVLHTRRGAKMLRSKTKRLMSASYFRYRTDRFLRLHCFESFSSRNAGEFEELISRHESRINHLEVGEEAGLACRDLAQILEEAGADPEDAAGWYIKAIEDLGDEPECVEALEKMFERGIWPLEIAKYSEPIFPRMESRWRSKNAEVLVEDEKVDFAARTCGVVFWICMTII